MEANTQRTGIATPGWFWPLALGLLLTGGVLFWAQIPQVLAAVPSNDNLANAAVMAAFPFSAFIPTADITDATRDTGETGTCGNFPLSGNTHSVWWRFTPGSNGWFSVDTFSSTYDTVLEVYTSTAASPSADQLVSVACNDDAGGGSQSAISQLSVAQTVTYYVAVRTYGATGVPGDLQLHGDFNTQSTIYVDPSRGLDTNPGTLAFPVKTLARGVSLVAAGGLVSITAGTYNENVTIDKNLTLAGSGAVAVTSFTLTNGAVLGTGPGNVTAPTVNVNQNGAAGAKIQDGVTLVAPGGTVNVAAGTYVETVTLNKDLTLQGPASVTALIQPATPAGNAIHVTDTGAVTIRRLTIQNANVGVFITAGSGHVISGNNFYTNTTAVNSSVGVTAAQNWWASDTGPTHATNLGGVGQAVTDNVSFTPWCTVAAPTCTPLAGLPTRLVFTASPGNTQASAAFTQQPLVQAVDAGGNLGINFNGPVMVTITTGTGTAGATLAGTQTKAATRGVANFAGNGLNINYVGTGYTLHATSGLLTAADSAAFNITASKLVFTTSPTNTRASTAFAQQPVVRAEDNAGHLDTTFAGQVTLGITGGTGGASLVGGSGVVTASGGIATYSGVGINYVGLNYQLTAAAASLTGGTSTAFNITANQLVFRTQPSDGAANTALPTQPVVKAEDGAAHVDTTFGGTVVASLGANPGGSTLAGTLSVPAVAGVITYTDLSLDKAGIGYTLVASSAPLAAGTSHPFTITGGVATHLAFGVQPAGAAADSSFTYTVRALDVTDNLSPNYTGLITVTLMPTSGTPLATLSGITFTNAISGVAVFTSAIDYLGTGYRLQAAAAGLTGTQSSLFNITAKRLVFQTSPGSTAAGTLFTSVVRAVDDALPVPHVDTTFGGTVALSIVTNPGGGTLSGGASVAATAGVVTFTNSINKVGTGYVLSATSGALLSGASAAFDITPAPAARLVLSNTLAAATAGVPFIPQPIVRVEDAYGNLATGFGGTVTATLAVNPGGSTLTGTLTATPVGGVATFAGLALDKVGTGYVLSFTTTSGITPTVSNPFDVGPNVAAVLLFQRSPSDSQTLVPFPTQPIVRAQDAYGNLATGFSGTVTLAIQPGSGTLGASLAGTWALAAASGLASYANVAVDRVGTSYILSATSGALTVAASLPFTITAATATVLLTDTAPIYTGAPQAILSATVPAGLTLNLTYTGTGTTTYGPTSTPPTNAGTYLAGAVVSDPNYVGTATHTWTITPVTAAVLLTDTAPIYNGLPQAVVSATNPAGLPLTVVYAGSGATVYGPTPAAPVNAGTYVVTGTVNAPPNYTGQGTGTWTIQPQAATVVVTNTMATYDGTPQTVLSASVPAGLAVTATYTGTGGTTYGPSTTPPTNVGTYAVGVVIVDVNYRGSGTGTLTINLASQTISFLPNPMPDRTFDQQPVVLTATATSGLAIVYYANGCSVVGNVLTFSALGVCQIRATQPGDANHLAAVEVSRSFNVTIGSQSIDFPPLADRPFDPLPFTVAATATSGLPVTFTAGAGSCSVAGNLVTLTGLGICTLTAHQAGSSTYAPAPDVTRQFNVTQVSQSINFPALADRPFDPLPFTVAATATSGLPVTFTTGAGICTVLGNTVTVTGVGVCALTAHQAGDTNYAPAPDVTHQFNVSQADQTVTLQPDLSMPRTVGDLPLTITATASSGLPVTVSVSGTCTLTGALLTLTSAGSCMVTAAQAGNANYRPASVAQTFVIHATGSGQAYLPLVTRSYVALPDLVVSFSLNPDKTTYSTAEGVVISVRVTNQGNTTAGPFWVDFYINPNTVPTAPNMQWDRQGCNLAACYGLAWYVGQALAPGQSVVLTSTPDSYYAQNTRWPGHFASGTTDLYVYVDSWNPGVATGAVLESNETNNRAERHGLKVLNVSGREVWVLPAQTELPPRPAVPGR